MIRLTDIILHDVKNNPNAIDLNELESKTILITGASGLVGTYLLATLRNAIIDSGLNILVYATIHSEPENHFNALTSHKNFKVFRGDLTSTSFISELPDVDFVIHAAGYGQPGKFLENPFKTITLNTTVTTSLISKLKEDGKFLFLSTSEVYSGLSTPPFKETEIGTTNTLHPRACYIEGKRCGEAICGAAKAQGLDVKSARLSLAYGPGTRRDDRRVINNFIKKAIDGKIDLLDFGLAKRTYCYVSDATWMMFNILLNGKSEIYNIGGISRTTIGDLAKEIGGIFSVPVSFPKISEEMQGAPDDVFLNMNKYEEEFGKFIFTSFDYGLRKTIEWQKLYFNETKVEK